MPAKPRNPSTLTVAQLLQHVSPDVLREAAAQLPARRGGRKPYGATPGRTWHLRANDAELAAVKAKAKAAGFGDVSAFVRETVDTVVPPRYEGGDEDGAPRLRRITVRLPDDTRARWEHLATEHGYPDAGSYARAALLARRSR